MGFVGSMLSGSKGAGYQGSGVSQAQLDTSYGQTQDAIKRQRMFTDALAGQNGLGNQSSVFQQQQGLANQLQNIGNGNGPNPALNQLNQATAANTANQAALMAGQRGSGQNAGLIARQAAMQGGANQQAAVGQAATLQSQQQLSALQQLQNQQNNMGGLANTQVNQQQTGLLNYGNSALQQQSNLLGMQQNINNANAGIAGANVKGQQGMLGGLANAAGPAMSMLGGSKGGGAATGGASSGGAAGGFGTAGGGAMPAMETGTMVAAKGGLVEQQYAVGGQIQDNPLVQAQAAPQGPQSGVGKQFAFEPYKEGTGASSAIAAPAEKSHMGAAFGSTAGGLVGGIFGGMFGGPVGAMGGSMLGGALGGAAGGALLDQAEGGKIPPKKDLVPAMVSPGEIYLPPTQAKAAAKGANPLAIGEKIPGKPQHPGNDYRNDVVPKTLEAGGIVIPNKVLQSKDASSKAAAFVQAHLNQRSLPKKK